MSDLTADLSPKWSLEEGEERGRGVVTVLIIRGREDRRDVVGTVLLCGEILWGLSYCVGYDAGTVLLFRRGML